MGAKEHDPNRNEYSVLKLIAKITNTTNTTNCAIMATWTLEFKALCGEIHQWQLCIHPRNLTYLWLAGMEEAWKRKWKLL